MSGVSVRGMGFEVVAMPYESYETVDGRAVRPEEELLIIWPDRHTERRRMLVEHHEEIERGRDEFSPDIRRDIARAYFLFEHHGAQFRIYLQEVRNNGATIARP